MVSLNASCDLVADLQSYGVGYEVPCEDSLEGKIVVPRNQFNLTDEEKSAIFSNIDPLRDDGDSGIQHFCDTAFLRCKVPSTCQPCAVVVGQNIMELREPFLVFQPDRAIAENPAITDGLTNPNSSPQLNVWKRLALGWGKG